jgi:hypothetical protein
MALKPAEEVTTAAVIDTDVIAAYREAPLAVGPNEAIITEADHDIAAVGVTHGVVDIEIIRLIEARNPDKGG